jgi:hypothetical protein
MAVIDFSDWLTEFGRPDMLWYVKRLSGNDTLANGSHQAGPYMPKELVFQLFPAVNRPAEINPDQEFDLYVDSHPDHRRVRAVWYNKKLHGGTRNEARLTRFGGRSSALLDPDSTGALTIFAFGPDSAGTARECHVWVCRSPAEEDVAEDHLGPVEPGKYLVWSPGGGPLPSLFATAPPPRTTCRLAAHEIPPPWLTAFPTGEEIIRKAIALRSDSGLDPDERLLRRRECEFELFQSVEEAVYMPVISAGFGSIKAFIEFAHKILQSRRSRAGRSLELHAREIFLEEDLHKDVDFSHQAESEPGRTPDFLFPSQKCYRDPTFPPERLRMLAAKTTLKDRWPQVLKEADRIKVKHLLTVQEGLPVPQFEQMKASGVRLVVPSGLRKSFHADIQPELITLESFIGDVRLLRIP